MEEAVLKPHRSRYWLNAKEKDTDPEGFARAAADVCAAYLGAPDAHMRGEHVVCTDEKTGIQALARIARTKPTAPGRVELQEFEYRRHGTLCLTANFEVATGEICSYTISPTRTVVEFADHIERTVAEDPGGRWTFVADHLNTHLSPFLVQQVARWCGITDDLGQAGKSGVLQSRASREAFLSDPTHRIRFVYTPRHRDLVQRPRPPAPQERRLAITRRAARAPRGLHQVLQRGPCPPLRVDVHGPRSQGRLMRSPSAPRCTRRRRR